MLISVVSHNQSELALAFLRDLHELSPSTTVVFTNNTTEPMPHWPEGWSVVCVQNASMKGFAANHNQALKNAQTEFVCVANPDIRLTSNPFPALLSVMDDPTVGLVVPQVLNPIGQVDDSVRRFPAPWHLMLKLFGKYDGRMTLSPNHPQSVPWAAGMFMLFRKEAFDAVGGFDEGFHLYYEDVDICARLWQSGWRVVHQPSAKVVHHAQRASRRNWQYFRWHIASILRFFMKHWGHIGRLERQATRSQT